MRTKQIYYCLLLVYLSILASCMVGKKYKAPEAPENISYRDTVFTDTSKLMSWFDLYKDPVLTQMIKAALDSNRDLLTASARVEEASYRTSVIKANLWPSFDYSATAGGGKAGTDAQKIAGGIQGGYMNAFALLNWEIDLWGKLRHANRSAVAEYLSSVQNRN